MSFGNSPQQSPIKGDESYQTSTSFNKDVVSKDIKLMEELEQKIQNALLKNNMHFASNSSMDLEDVSALLIHADKPGNGAPQVEDKFLNIPIRHTISQNEYNSPSPHQKSVRPEIKGTSGGSPALTPKQSHPAKSSCSYYPDIERPLQLLPEEFTSTSQISQCNPSNACQGSYQLAHNESQQQLEEMQKQTRSNQKIPANLPRG